MNSFFQNNTYVVDEKIQALSFGNEYKVYNAEGSSIGVVREVMSTSRKLASLFVSKKNLPMLLQVEDASGNVAATISRGWTFFLATLKIMDENGTQVGYIKQKFGLKAKLEVFDMSNKLIATVQGNWTAWDFEITDASGAKIGSLSKKFNGLVKEIFTDADKYVISIEPTVTDAAQRIAIASTAAVIDVLYKERD